MPILITTTTATGVTVGYHRARRLTVDLVGSVATALVDSYPNEQALLDNTPLAWQWTMDVPMSAFNGGTSLLSELETALTTMTGSPFLNGTIVSDNSQSVPTLKMRKRAEITRDRLAADADHFTYTYTDAGGAGVSKDIRTADKDMFDLLSADARIAKQTDGTMPANWPGGWKAIDNTVVPISTPSSWNQFFVAMYDAGVANFTKSQNLKSQIDAIADTDPDAAAKLDAIHW